MKVALISFEYPPKTAVGGIGTYVYQIAHLLQARGNYIEVFTTTEIGESISEKEDNVLVHRIGTTDRSIFRKIVCEKFIERSKIVSFDIIETPEYGADCIYIQQATKTPIHVKLHTPDFLVTDLNRNHVSVLNKIRYIMGALIRLKKPKPYWIYSAKNDLEYRMTKEADFISSPSKDLARIVSEKWNISKKAIQIMPYPFTPSKCLLDIPPGVNDTSQLIITFIGKLEKRKGILILLEVIPKVLDQYPKVIFRLIGRPSLSPDGKKNMSEYLVEKLNRYSDNLEFIGEISYDKLPKYLKETTICLFPSLWENFPNVCLEAMSAARFVIGSENGGMAEMLENDCGVLVSPENAEEIIAEILTILKSPEDIIQYGERARHKVLNSYNQKVIGDTYEQTVKDIISAQ
jgi:glycosyltransferase involved in cell wall biosynthesis